MTTKEIIRQIKIAIGTALIILLILLALGKSSDNETGVNISNTPNVNISNIPNVNISKMPTTYTNITNQETDPVPVKIITPPISKYEYYIRWACYQYPAYTVIDIYNPQSIPVTINRTNIIVSKIDRNNSSYLPSQLLSYTIQPNNAVEITCDTMIGMNEIPSNPATGFMIINSSWSLNVIGTYITDTTQYSEIILPNQQIINISHI